MKKWQKVTAVTTATAMTVQLAACGAVEEYGIEETSIPYVEEEIIEETAIATDSVTGEMYDENGELVDIYESDYMDGCDDWYEEEDGSFVCEDESSPYYNNHFFDGIMYATIGAMVASSFYKSKNRVSGTGYYKDDQNNAQSGGGGYSGGTSSSSKSTSTGVTTSPNNGASTGSSSGTETNNAGTTKPSNGASSYTSGKSGFSSGGTSRGGGGGS